MSQEDPLPEFIEDRIYEDKDSELWLHIPLIIAAVTLLIIIIKIYE